MASKKEVIKLERYNSNWQQEYAEEEKLLKEVLENRIIEIHHIGATSIKGLRAVPIIDILIVIESLESISEINEILCKYDYHCLSQDEVQDRYLFAKEMDDARTCYVHFVEPNSDIYYNGLYFKMYLLKHPEYIQRYSRLKEELVSKYEIDRHSYTVGKERFIAGVISLAKKEFGTKNVEYWDLYDKNHERLGKIVKRGDTLSDDEYHLVVNAWIKNKDNKFLISERSLTKSHPLMWETPGGSVLKEEDSITAAIREVKEQLGIDISNVPSTFVGSTTRYYKGCPDILDVWLFNYDTDIRNIRNQPEKVNDVMWASREEIKTLYNNNRFDANAYFEDVIK